MLLKVGQALVFVAAVSARFINVRIDACDDCDDGDTQSVARPGTTMLPAGCYWDGTAPFCAGSCRHDYTCKTDRSGDGDKCWSGEKALCCDDKSACPSAIMVKEPVKELVQEPVLELKQKTTMLPAGCYWDGTAPFCAGSCRHDYTCKTDRSGDGDKCWSGEKALCCDDKSACPSALAVQESKQKKGL